MRGRDGGVVGGKGALFWAHEAHPVEGGGCVGRDMQEGVCANTPSKVIHAHTYTPTFHRQGLLLRLLSHTQTSVR